MPIEESLPKSDDIPQQTFTLGQEVFDKEGKKIGRVQARFSHYILVERGSIFVKAYYVPHSAVSGKTKASIRLSLAKTIAEPGLNRLLMICIVSNQKWASLMSLAWHSLREGHTLSRQPKRDITLMVDSGLG